jgi:hypothetical protein
MLNRQTTIFAYGFDAAGFEIRDQPSELSDGSRLEFVSFSNTRDLNEADGVIIPQGIFEKIETRRTGTFGAAREIWVDRCSSWSASGKCSTCFAQGSGCASSSAK